MLAGATFVTRFGVFVVPFLTLFMTQRGFDAAHAGWAVGAYASGAFAAAWAGGWMADHMGRNITMALSSLLGAAAMLLLARAESFAWLVTLSGLAGFVSEAGHPASNALVQDIVSAEHRVAAFAVLRWMVNLGWALGPATAGLLAEKSFDILFIADAATSAVFGFVALFLLPKGRAAAGSARGWRPALRSIFRNPPFLLLFLACLAVSFLFRQTNTSFTLHFQRSGLPVRWCGMVLALNGVMICLLELPLVVATRRWRVEPAIALGYAVMGGSFLWLLTGADIVTMTAFMAVFTVGEMLAFSRQQAYAASLAPEDMRGRYNGFLSLAWSLGNVCGAAGGLKLYDWSPAFLWTLCATAGAGAAVLLVTGSRLWPRRIAAEDS